ncbi:MAG: type IV pilus modification protein PilV [Gammaproteobacteria bacterium]|nr:type IV pilus modification protein PilV [Gammaproteobacteria bacterium]
MSVNRKPNTTRAAHEPAPWPGHDRPDTAREASRGRTLHGQSGVTLIEVLIALLVMSIGLLGLAALQTQSLRFNTDSMIRTQATSLANEIIEQMRAAGQTGVADYAYDLAGGDVPSEACDLSDTSTSPGEQVQCWFGRVTQMLPLGTATILSRAGSAGTYDVEIMWLDREPREFSGETRPRLPANANECEQMVARQWLDNRCMMTQMWTVAP